MLTVSLKTEGNAELANGANQLCPSVGTVRAGGEERERTHALGPGDVHLRERGDSTLLWKHLPAESRTAKMSTFTTQPVGRVTMCLSIRAHILSSGRTV